MNHIKIENIGLDLDGVLFNQEQFELQKRLIELEKERCEWLKILSNLIWLMQKPFLNYEDYQYYLFWGKHILDYLFFTDITEDAKLYLNKWKEENRKLHIISGRKELKFGFAIYNLLIFFTKLSINYHKIPYHGLYFCSDSNAPLEKKDWCDKLNIDLMIDNRFDVINSLEGTCNGVCMLLNANNTKHQNPKIVHDFLSVDNYIRTLERKRSC